MSNEMRIFYNDKYNGESYRGMYADYIFGKYIILPAHYTDCARYIKNVLCVDIEDKILEIGCGTGALLFAMNKHLDYENITGIDISDVAKELSIAPEVTFQGDASKLNFVNKEFDLVVSIGTYEHLIEKDIEASFNEVVRVGKKAVLWIDKDKGNSDHIFNEDPEWWARKIVEIAGAESAFVDKDMKGGSGTNPILINFDLDKILLSRNVVVIKERGERI